MEIVSRLSDIEEITITGHDKRRGNIKGKFLRALAGWTDAEEQLLQTADKDFAERKKDAMRKIINRERAKKGLPLLEPGLVSKQRDEDEDENDWEDEPEDPEREMLEEEGVMLFEIHDEGGDEMYDFYEPEEGIKPGSFVLLDYATEQLVVIEKNDPKPSKDRPLPAPRLRKVHLEDQWLDHNAIKKLKDVRSNIKVFSGESCGSGYAAQMVWNMSGGMPGTWY